MSLRRASQLKFLYVNGELVRSKVSPPYAFGYVLDEAGDYDIYGVIQTLRVIWALPSHPQLPIISRFRVTFDFNIDSNFLCPHKQKQF